MRQSLSSGANKVPQTILVFGIWLSEMSSSWRPDPKCLPIALSWKLLSSRLVDLMTMIKETILPRKKLLIMREECNATQSCSLDQRSPRAQERHWSAALALPPLWNRLLRLKNKERTKTRLCKASYTIWSSNLLLERLVQPLWSFWFCSLDWSLTLSSSRTMREKALQASAISLTRLLLSSTSLWCSL